MLMQPIHEKSGVVQGLTENGLEACEILAETSHSMVEYRARGTLMLEILEIYTSLAKRENVTSSSTGNHILPLLERKSF